MNTESRSPERETFRFESTASYKGLEQFYECFEASTACQQMPSVHSLAVKLSYDELVSNIIKFAGEKGYRVVLDLTFHPDEGLCMTLRDESPAFDPWSQQLSENLGHETEDDDIQDVAVGGRGLFMVRQLLDSAAHSVVNGWNCNIMKKGVHSGS